MPPIQEAPASPPLGAVPQTTPPTQTTSTERSRLIASAQSLPDLIAKADALDPALANKLKGGATVASATPIGALVGGAIGMLVTKYGLGWDAATVNFISGVLVLAGGYVAHWVQARVTSIIPKN